MRINKFLAQQNLGSRRYVDELIDRKLIYVNGELAQHGYKLKFGDKIRVKENSQVYEYCEESAPEHLYIALNKPQGVSSSCAVDDSSNIISFLLNRAKYNPCARTVTHNNLQKQNLTELMRLLENNRLYPIGRLDKYSEGLIILTNDGDLTQKLSHPSYQHEKEYLVVLEKDFDVDFLDKFSKGVEIEFEDGSKKITRECRVDAFNKSENTFKVVLKQGMNRQIRRMAEALGNKVKTLIRTRIATLELNGLKSGEFRLLSSEEIEAFNFVL